MKRSAPALKRASPNSRLAPDTSEQALKDAVTKAGYIFVGFGENVTACPVTGTVEKTMKIEGMMCEHCEQRSQDGARSH